MIILDGTYVIAIDIGGTKTLAAAVRLEDGKILKRIAGTTNTASPSDFIAGIETVIQELRSSLAEISFTAVGIGTAGHVDPTNGYVSSLNLGLDNFPIKGLLHDFTGLPVFIDNDANAGALGEMHYGAAKGKRHFAFLSVGTGIGVGLVLDGKIYHGKGNNAGEIGHVGLYIRGDKCKCGGTGCFENMASGPAMVDAFKRQRSAGYETKLLAEDISPQDIFAAAEAHSDPLSVKVIVDAAEALGYGIRGLNNLLDLELIVLGGGIPLAAPPYFLTHIESSAMGGVNRVHPSECPIILSKLYPDSIIMGAASLVKLSHEKPGQKGGV